jgi:UDP-N-acetylglucosamine transferase subunit ALG13
MDEIARDLGEEIIIQKGFTQYEPTCAKSFSFVPYEQALDFFKRAKIIAGHASAGPIMYARQFNKPLIIFPRDGRLKELIDNHQIETARAIEGSSKMIEVVYHEKDLTAAVRRAILKAEAGLSYEGTPALSSLVGYIRDFVQSIGQ